VVHLSSVVGVFVLYMVPNVFFFFSSRRRHTRCYRDWSSDVCSSDLSAVFPWPPLFMTCERTVLSAMEKQRTRPLSKKPWTFARQIGRASCRERVYISVYGGAWTKKRRQEIDRASWVTTTARETVGTS